MMNATALAIKVREVKDAASHGGLSLPAVVLIGPNADLFALEPASAGLVVHHAPDLLHALPLLEGGAVALALLDADGKSSPLQLYRDFQGGYPHIPAIVLLPREDVAEAVALVRAGARHVLARPVSARQLAEECLQIATLSAGRTFFSRDAQVLRLLDLARRVATSDATALISGESGCGKEVLARFIHEHSLRSGGPFVAINCAAIPESLLEATLFGYEKGAFSGAVQAHAGKFEQAQGGTLLLDEISEMPLSLQAKLLRVIQERQVERLGGGRTVALDIRIIATSNRDLEAECRQGRFREDLFYRLNVMPFVLPPLRERLADIAPLAWLYVRRMAAQLGQPDLRLSPDAVALLEQHAWPGNVRELENTIQRAAILANGDVINVEHLAFRLQQISYAPAAVVSHRGLDMKTVERLHIIQTLKEAGGCRKLAGKLLGISERTLRHKLQQYRLSEQL